MSPESDEPLCEFRAAEPDDARFLLKTWVRSFAHKRKPPEGVAPKHYRASLRATVGDILRRPETRVVIACNPLNPRLIWGFAVFAAGPTPVLYYVYVKPLFRGHGIGTELTRISRDGRPGVLQIAFRTPACKRFLPEAKFDPKLVRRHEV